jgi:hypothetical protein
MRAPRRFNSPSFVILAALVSASAVPAFAAGPGDGSASPKPKPAVEKRIYTNDDLDSLASFYGGPARQNEPAASSAPEHARVLPARAPSPAALPNERNPVWYAQQIMALQAEMASIDNEIARLQQFRASSIAPGTPGAGVVLGLQLYAPCDGITTDNKIAQLAAHRNEIARQLDAVGDTARLNGLTPGTIHDPDQILQAAQSRVVLTPDERRAALAVSTRVLSAELEEVQDTLGSMNQQAASQNMTLLPVTPGYGGNMTTNYIEDLDRRASDLQQKFSDVEDAARASGIPPGALR